MKREGFLSDQSSRRASSQDKLETVVDDVFGVDFKIARTLRDTLLRPGRVADAALANDHSRYSRPLRVYLVLCALMTLVFGWIGFGEGNTLSAIFGDSPAAMARLQQLLADMGATIAQADEVTERWLGWANWPSNAASSLTLVLAIWAMRPQIGLFGAFMLYLVMFNALNLIVLPLVTAALFVGAPALLAAAGIGAPALLAYGGLVLHRRAADTALGLGMRIAALGAALILMAAIVVGLSLATLEIAFRTEIGASRIGLMIEASRAAAAASDAGAETP